MEPARTHKHTKAARRGLTFIEVICAVAMLAMVSTAVLGAFNSMMAAQERQKHRLAAMELAGRLILQYLDDKDTMPQKGLPILSEGERYRWDMQVVPVRLLPARPEVAEDRTSASTLSVDRMEAVTVNVWLSEESGGSSGFDPHVPSATLTRLMDPIALRNPDTTNNLAHDATKQQELIAKFRTIGRNVAPPKSGAKPGDKGSTPGSKSSPAGASPSVPPSKTGPIPSKGDKYLPVDPRRTAPPTKTVSFLAPVSSGGVA